MNRKDGRFVTFYSYKGGSGRTMALANVAWILASNGYDVLLIDWDLEAPGLHRYLRPFLIDPELSSTPGLIDFVWDAARVNMTPAHEGLQSARTEFPSLENYVVGLDWDFHDKGSISFIPAGRQDENYAQRVNTFNWDNFYERLGGGNLLQAQRDILRANYDYILIDSRTGVSDTSSICTVQMPDLLLVFFTLNRQSIKGAAAVAASIRAQRGEQFPIYPVPTRIENAQSDKRDAVLKYARRIFAPFLAHIQFNQSQIDPAQQASYWRTVATPYDSYYAFEEVPAVFRDEPGDPGKVLASNERICSWITDQLVSSLQPEKEELREAVVQAYVFTEDDDIRVEWEPRADAFNFFYGAVERLQRQLRRNLWRWATIGFGLFFIVFAVMFLFKLNELSMAKSDLSIAQSELSASKSLLTEVLDDAQRALTIQNDNDKNKSIGAIVNKITEVIVKGQRNQPGNAK